MGSRADCINFFFTVKQTLIVKAVIIEAWLRLLLNAQQLSKFTTSTMIGHFEGHISTSRRFGMILSGYHFQSMLIKWTNSIFFK